MLYRDILDAYFALASEMRGLEFDTEKLDIADTPMLQSPGSGSEVHQLESSSPSNAGMSFVSSQSSAQMSVGSTTLQEYEVVPAHSKIGSSLKPAKIPCSMVERRLFNRKFFGREEELEQLDQALLPDLNRDLATHISPQKHAVLSGMGGLGKSEIAIHFAFTRKKFFDAVFWIQADETTKLEEGKISSRNKCLDSIKVY